MKLDRGRNIVGKSQLNMRKYRGKIPVKFDRDKNIVGKSQSNLTGMKISGKLPAKFDFDNLGINIRVSRAFVGTLTPELYSVKILRGNPIRI